MKYKDLDPDEVFFFDDNFDYPKVKTENGHKDLRDNVTGSMPDDYEVVSVHDLTSKRDRLAEALELVVGAYDSPDHKNVFRGYIEIDRAALDKAKG